jgi:glycosyltransferase involved in cell wall biosynthesis
MRVAVDGRTLQTRPVGGVGRSLGEVLNRLPEHVRVTLLTDRRLPPPTGRLDVHALGAAGPAAVWLQVAAPMALQRSRPDVFHCPFYGLPYRLPVPGVVTLHDLTFEHAESFMPGARRAVFRAQARHAARVAAAVLTVSEHVKQDIQDRYRVPPDRIVIAPHGISSVFAPSPSPAAHADSARPYLVALAGAPRRNVAAAVAAWQLVRDEYNVDLVVVGSIDGTYACPGLRVVTNLSDEKWAELLAGAVAFLYPTRYEGFGMPGLEALAAGTPVVCAPVGALPEVLGDAAEWSRELSPEALAEALHNLLGDSGRRAEMRARGLAHAEVRRGWDSAVAASLQAYSAALT